jgi:hypothetical protein
MDYKPFEVTPCALFFAQVNTRLLRPNAGRCCTTSLSTNVPALIENCTIDWSRPLRKSAHVDLLGHNKGALNPQTVEPKLVDIGTGAVLPQKHCLHLLFALHAAHIRNPTE